MLSYSATFKFQMESQYFCSNTWPLYVRMLSACYYQYSTQYSAIGEKGKPFLELSQLYTVTLRQCKKE